MKNFLIIFFCLLILNSDQAIWASSSLNNKSLSFFSERLINWPNWSLPVPFRSVDLEKDLIYPDFFEGLWQVYSLELGDQNTNFLRYEAKFQLDLEERVRGDRSFNAKSVGKEIFGQKLIEVLNDPNSFNRQIAIFKGGEYLETKIVGRKQEMDNDNFFLTDELHVQIFHSDSITRVNQVETLSRYNLCKELEFSFNSITSNSICGEQWQARYNFPINILRSTPISTNHFLIFLIPKQDQIQIKDVLDDLSIQKDQLDSYYH